MKKKMRSCHFRYRSNFL